MNIQEMVKQLSSMYQPIFSYDEISVHRSLNKKEFSYLKRLPEVPKYPEK